MNAAPDAHVMPPVERLLALDTLTLWRVVLAMLGGGSWEGPCRHLDVPVWNLRHGPFTRTLFTLDASYEDGTALPDPLSDPAAAWELETRELNGWKYGARSGQHCFTWYTRGGIAIGVGPWHADRKHASAFAVLLKHQYGPLRPLITPLLERIKEEGLDK
jgi:hypothetical protein